MLQDSGLGNIIRCDPAGKQDTADRDRISHLRFWYDTSVGSSNHAQLTIASGIMASMPAGRQLYIAQSSVLCDLWSDGTQGHVNDAGFWLVSTFLEIDEDNIKIMDDRVIDQESQVRFQDW